MNVFDKIERLRVARPLRFHDFDDRRNHFTRFFDHDGVADADILAFDLVFVVQRCPRNRAATDQDRLQFRDRGENSSATNLNNDVEQFGFNAFGRVLVGNCPPRGFGGESERFALRQGVDFDHSAIRFVPKIAPDLVEIANRVENWIH